MQSTFTGHIAPSEWRWVVITSVTLLALAFLPFALLAVIQRSATDWYFMGVFHDYVDGAVYLSKMQQGINNQWLMQMQHTPEAHNGTLLNGLYVSLGHLSRLLFMPPVLVFHIVRVAASFFMYFALYQLGASIWVKLRTRRIFFLVVVLVSGLGWLYAMITRQSTLPDITTFQWFPFDSSLANIHYPLSIGVLALLANISIAIFRPGTTVEPSVRNEGTLVFILSLVLVSVYPEAILIFGLAFIVTTAIYGYSKRALPLAYLRWSLWLIVPMLPGMLYYFLVWQYNPAAREWFRQRMIPAPSVAILLISLCFVAATAIPAFYRAVRRFEPDGDRFMLIWLLVMLVVMYLPLPLGQHAAVGIMIPLAYFATRALEDFWFRYLPRRRRYRLMVALIPIVLFGHLFNLFAPALPLLNRGLGSPYGMTLEPEYRVTFDWLEPRLLPETVILAAPETSTWIPFYVHSRVVYGHPVETLDADNKSQLVRDWYGGADPSICQRVLSGEDAFINSYRVTYVLIGPRERALGETSCMDSLDRIASFGQVDIYRVVDS